MSCIEAAKQLNRVGEFAKNFVPFGCVLRLDCNRADSDSYSSIGDMKALPAMKEIRLLIDAVGIFENTSIYFST